MKIALNSLEIPISENPVAIPVEEEIVEADTPVEVVQAMAEMAGHYGSLQQYITETVQYLANMHGFTLPPISGSLSDQCATFLERLAEHGLVTFLEK